MNFEEQLSVLYLHIALEQIFSILLYLLYPSLSHVRAYVSPATHPPITRSENIMSIMNLCIRMCGKGEGWDPMTFFVHEQDSIHTLVFLSVCLVCLSPIFRRVNGIIGIANNYLSRSNLIFKKT